MMTPTLMSLSMMAPMSFMSRMRVTTTHTPMKMSTPVKMFIEPDSFMRR